MNQKKDIILIQEIQNGNQSSEAEFYVRYKKIVEDYLKSKYGYCDFDDDVSEIMIKVFTNLNKYNPDKSQIKSWVITIAKNHMIDKWRASGITYTINNTGYNNEFDGMSVISGNSHNNTITTTMDEQIYNSYTTTGTPFDNFVSCSISNCCVDEDNDVVGYLATNLTSCEYTLINMKYVQGFTYDEIGSEFNLTSNTVSNKVNYIKSKLRKEYENLLNE